MLILNIPIVCKRFNHDQVVGVENLEVFEEQAQAPGYGNQTTGDGRREGNALKLTGTIFEQAFDLGGGDTACVY